MARPTLIIEIDWTDDGGYGDANEDVTADIEALRIRLGRQGPLGMASPSSCELVLANDDKLYSPEWSSGALFGKLLPRRSVRVRTTAPTAQTLFTGRIDDIIIEPALDSRKARINCLDDMAFRLRETGAIYSRRTGGSPLLEPDGNGVGPLTGVAVGEVLDEVDWPSGDRTIDAGITEMGTWWTSGIDSLSALAALVTEEHAFIYIGRDGKCVFEDRGHRYKGNHLTSQATYTDDPDGVLRYDSFDPYALGLENVYNAARAPAQERESVSGIPWDFGGVPSLAPDEVKVFLASWDNPASSDPTGVRIANSEADGSGDDLTSEVGAVVSGGGATRVTLTLTNNTDPPRTAYITTLQSISTRRVPADELVEAQASDGDSQGIYGVREFPGTPAFLGKPEQAESWAGYAVAAFKNPIPVVRLGFGPYNDTILTNMLKRKPSERVTVVNDELGLNADFFIEGIKYEMVAGGGGAKGFRTNMTLSKIVSENQYFLFNHATLGLFNGDGRFFA